jgi:site-specific DNA-methyltransferase (adenine-specific)
MGHWGAQMDKNTQKTMFSSKTNEWSTPDDFYQKLNKMFGPFSLDPCSDGINNKTVKFFTPKDNGLEQDWGGNNVFMNPPYGREIGKWIKKAYEEGLKPLTQVVCLIPARTDTTYWHEYVMKANLIYFVKGRLKFGDSTNSAPFPSAVVVFDSSPYLERYVRKPSPIIGALERE